MRALLAMVVIAGCHAPRVGAPCTAGPAFAPFDAIEPAAPRPLPVDGVLDAIVASYQRDARADQLPGVGCPFAPTCSVYARAALHRYGPLGVLWIVDRTIVREHVGASADYPMTCVDHTSRIDDALP